MKIYYSGVFLESTRFKAEYALYSDSIHSNGQFLHRVVAIDSSGFRL
jgi:hypothetical protein